MRLRPGLLLAPVVVAASMLLAFPSVVRAGNGMTEVGTTTYEAVPSKGVIQVTIRISVTNNTPSVTEGDITYSYYWDSTYVIMPLVAGPISATSDAGSVSGGTYETYAYWRVVKLNYPAVWYGQTRVVTATYSIPAQPGALDGFRAGRAYASLCAVGNGADSGSVSVVVPDGFDLKVLTGDQVTKTGDSNGKQVFSSGTLTSPLSFVTCVEATNPANLTHIPVTAGGQAFDLRGWPEDSAWSAGLRDGLSGHVSALEELTGLKMPGGTIVVSENGGGLNDQGIAYDSSTKTVSIPEGASASVIAHALSHIWFNSARFQDAWVYEGLAQYAEKAAGQSNYTPCDEPGAYPGLGSPNLTFWQTLTFKSTAQDLKASDWQYAASCYFFTAMADAMGPEGFKSFMKAAAAGEMAYIGATPGEKPAGAERQLTSKQVLDLLDERGMVEGGVEDLDEAQTMLADWGIFDGDTLQARSVSRATYHDLVSLAGKWKLPLAVRGPMSGWVFPTADAAMATAKQILDLRDSIDKQVSGFSLDGTAIQTKFESAATQADLDALLALTKQEADAAAKVGQATTLHDQSRSILQTIGLLGSDVDSPLKQARDDLGSVKTEAAISEAQAVIDKLNGSSDQGLMRTAVVAVILVILLVVAFVSLFLRRRRRPAATTWPGGGGPGLVMPPQGPPPNWNSPGQVPPGSSQPGWAQPGAQPAAWQPPATQPPGAWQPPATQPPTTDAPSGPGQDGTVG